MYRKILIMLAAAGLGAGVPACGSAALQITSATASSSPAAARSASPAAPATGHDSPRPAELASHATSLRLLTEPAAGIGPIYQLITAARSSVDDTSRADVAAIVATFNADFAGQAITPPDGADLVWSPTNAQASVLSVIDEAKHSLAVEDEEMDDPTVTAALAAAARRGVDVTVIMTADSDWDTAFTELARAGAHVRLYADDSSALYIHAKAIVADAGRPGQQALVGSQNFSVASLDYNRELGILTRDPALIAAVSATLAADYRGATPYAPPAASTPGPTTGSAAWCTATASVYDAADDENNVYVHSNQPDQDATASADGYSHTYRTDSSGYALIYLNGPPPGVRITVTVGAATCTASD